MFERSNVAADHQQLLMVTLKRVAQKHGMECLFHEKPFEGINGSGKHVNFSLGNATEGNLLLPGDTPHDNAQFLVFCAAVIRAVHKYGGLLRASVASATNDHRLGANEAPPAIISIFLGDQLTDVFDQIAKGGATNSKEKGTLMIGVDTLPVLPTDPGDRNRTSPFAFTGNRFEFRAPGSLQSIAGPMVTINTILAEALDYIATEIETLIADGAEFNAAVQKVLEEIITDHGSVVFNGDGYSDDWQIEAAARGLPNLRTTLDALPELITEEAMELFSHYGVFSHREMHSRYEIALEQYALSIGVEARLTLEMANTVILPAALRYQTELATNVASLPGRRHRAPTPPPSTRCRAAIKDAARPASRRCAPQLAHDDASTDVQEEAEHAAHDCCRPWPRCAPPPTSSRRSSPTTSGRCPPTRRCSSSCRPPPRSAIRSATSRPFWRTLHVFGHGVTGYVKSSQIRGRSGGGGGGCRFHPPRLLAGGEVEQPRRVVAEDRLVLLLGEVRRLLGDQLARLRPRRVGVGEVAGPQQVLVREQVQRVVRGQVVLERGVHVVADVLARQLRQPLDDAALGVHPGGVVHAVHVVRQPAGVALGDHQLQVGVALEHAAEHHQPHHVLDGPDDAEEVVHRVARGSRRAGCPRAT